MSKLLGRAMTDRLAETEDTPKEFTSVNEWRIVKSTPENIIETIDWAVKRLKSCKWYEFSKKSMFRKAIVDLAIKRVRLLEEGATHERTI